MSVHDESTFEANIETHLVGHGWHQIDPASYDRKAGLFLDEVVTFVRASQPTAWEQLVTRHGGEQLARQKFGKVIADALDHRGTISVLREPVKDSGVTVRLCFFKPANALTPELGERYAANRLAVVRQLHHSESNPADSVDLTLVVNGIPVATAELKNPLTHQTIEHAMDQYRTDRNPHDLIFARRTLVHFAVDPHRVAMTTRLAREETVFLPFNQGSAGAGYPGAAGNPGVGFEARSATTSGYQTAYLWEQVWQRDAWLDLLGTFVHVEDGLQGKGTVLFPRFHQWHAVRSLVDATYDDGAGVDRLVMHSAGSGKSNTIAWTAHSLSRLHDADDQPIFDKVVVITDRRVLDRQLQETVAGLEHTPGTIVRVDQHSSQLKAALEGNAARIVITTLQKFPVIAQTADAVVGRRFAVIVDEAHSSTTGEAVSKLKKVLGGGFEARSARTSTTESLAEAEADDADAEAADEPDAALLASARDRGKHANLSFFAFTATPKPKTLETFGRLDADGQRRPFHTYSMRQAIEEGFILDVLASYTTYATYYKLANAHPRNDPDMEASKARAALARFVSLHPYQLEQKAEVIVEHFRQKSAAKIDGRAKAMVVTRSRLHAIRTKQALDAYIQRKGYDQGDQPLRTLVAFSGEVRDPDAPDVTFTESGLNGFPESQLPKRFAAGDYQVLVVAEKYQTGYDEPLLHTMYVDKLLAGVKAVQTLSRLNRTHPGKSDTFVLDFANSAEKIQEAFKPFFEQTSAEPTDPNLLYEMDRTLHDAGVISADEQAAAVRALLSGGAANQQAVYANLNPAVDRFDALSDEDQETFRHTLTGYLRAYAFLAQIMPWTDLDLESLYLYGRALQPLLPAVEGEPLPQISDAVLLTHLRTEARGEQENLSLVEGDTEPGVALPGGGMGAMVEAPTSKLSELIATLNERYGLNLTEADKVWFEQQKQAIKEDATVRQVALNNDRDQYRVVLEQHAEDAIVDRHESNGQLFNAFFDKPGFREALLEYLAGSYDEIRGERAS
ncbi:MAG: type I restriction endonuclease subunit R [Nocardioidaceae bacterium]